MYFVSQFRTLAISQYVLPSQVYLKYSLFPNEKISFRLIFPSTRATREKQSSRKQAEQFLRNLIFQIQSAYVPRREARIGGQWVGGGLAGRVGVGPPLAGRSIPRPTYPTPPTRPDFPFYSGQTSKYGYVCRCRADNCSLFATASATQITSEGVVDVACKRSSSYCTSSTTPVSAKPPTLDRTALTNHKKTTHKH